MHSQNGALHPTGPRPDERRGEVRSIADVLAELLARHGLVSRDDESVFAREPPSAHSARGVVIGLSMPPDSRAAR